MLSARVAAFRQLSRAGDEAVAAGDPAKRLQSRIRAPHVTADAGRTERGRASGGRATAVAGAAAFARSAIAAPLRRRDHPPARCGAARAVSRSRGAARYQRPVVSRYRRGRRRAGGDGDVAAGARPLDAARALERRRKDRRHELLRSRSVDPCAARRRARRRPCARRRGASRHLSGIAAQNSRRCAPCVKPWPQRS